MENLTTARSTRTVRTQLPAILFAVGTLCLASPILSQTESPNGAKQAPPIKVRTAMVLVPTIVTDRAGAHVSGLARDTFTVLQNGQLQKIAFFEHVQTQAELMQRPAETEGVFTNRIEAGSQRLTIFVLDMLNSSLTEQASGREKLLKLLSESMEVTEPICLLAIDSDGLKVIHDFTTDPAELAEALKQTTAESSSKDLPQANPMASAFRDFHGWHSQSKGRAAAATSLRLQMLQATIYAREVSESERDRLTLEMLREIGESFTGIPGRKSMIWAKGGFPFEIDAASQFGSHERVLLPVYENAWRALNRANIAVYPLDVEELLNTGYVSASVGQQLPQHTDIRSTVSNLEEIAEATGGKLCNASTGAKACFRQAADDSTDYYLIGFYEHSEKLKPGWRKLSVKVQVPDFQVRARSGYYVGGVHDNPQKQKEDLAIALASPLDYTGIPLTVRWTATAESKTKDKRRVGFSFAIPPGAITVDETDSNHLSLEFAAMATSETGSPVGSFSQSVDGRLSPAIASSIESQGVNYPGTIDLPPGQYTMSFAVRDILSRQIGTVSAPIVVH